MTHASAVARSIPVAESDTFSQRPVDLVHLARHTLGNRDLEREVLQIFVRQSVLYLDRIRGAKTGTERQMAAHTIKGSARGIGAWEVADLAEKLENSASGSGIVASLDSAVEKTNRFISSLLGDNS